MPIVQQTDGSWKLKLYAPRSWRVKVLLEWRHGRHTYPTISLVSARGSSQCDLICIKNISEDNCQQLCSGVAGDFHHEKLLNGARKYLESRLGFKLSEYPLLVKKFQLNESQISKLCGQGGNIINSIARKVGMGVRFPHKGVSGFTWVEGTAGSINEFKKEAAHILNEEINEFVRTEQVGGGIGQTRSVMPSKLQLNPRRGEIMECLFFEKDDNQDRYDFQIFLNFLLSGQHTLDICVFTITDNKIANGILSEFRDGVHVRIITDNDKANDRGSDIYKMVKAGIPTKVDRTDVHMHHKFAIVDGALVINGSFNWTKSAQTRNFENVVISNNSKMVNRFQKHFDHLWNSNHMETLKS